MGAVVARRASACGRSGAGGDGYRTQGHDALRRPRDPAGCGVPAKRSYGGADEPMNRVFAGLVLLVCSPVHQLIGQSDPRLASALRLAQEGLGDSARMSVNRLLGATDP